MCCLSLICPCFFSVSGPAGYGQYLSNCCYFDILVKYEKFHVEHKFSFLLTNGVLVPENIIVTLLHKNMNEGYKLASL